MEPSIGYAVISAFFAAGAAWGAVRSALNGTRGKVDDVHKRLAAHIDDESVADKVTHERIARVETKIDMLLTNRFTCVKKDV